MKSVNKFIPTIVNLIFANAFLIHIAIIGYWRVYPENPSIRIYYKDLKDIEFPFSFKICVREQKHAAQRYKKIGYKEIFLFFEGRPDYNASTLGWAGHGRNKSTLGTVTGFMISQFLIKFQ